MSTLIWKDVCFKQCYGVAKAGDLLGWINTTMTYGAMVRYYHEMRNSDSGTEHIYNTQWE